MGIKTLTRNEFDGFKPMRAAGIEALIQEKEWFRDDASNILGAVLFDKTDKDWSFVIMGRDEKGKFRAIELDASIRTQDDARKKLMAKMSELEAKGDTVFPQDDD